MILLGIGLALFQTLKLLKLCCNFLTVNVKIIINKVNDIRWTFFLKNIIRCNWIIKPLDQKHEGSRNEKMSWERLEDFELKKCRELGQAQVTQLTFIKDWDWCDQIWPLPDVVCLDVTGWDTRGSVLACLPSLGANSLLTLQPVHWLPLHFREKIFYQELSLSQWRHFATQINNSFVVVSSRSWRDVYFLCFFYNTLVANVFSLIMFTPKFARLAYFSRLT